METSQKETSQAVPTVNFYRSWANEITTIVIGLISLSALSYVLFKAKIIHSEILKMIHNKTFLYDGTFSLPSFAVILSPIILLYAYFFIIKKVIVTWKLALDKNPEIKFSENEFWSREYGSTPWKDIVKIEIIAETVQSRNGPTRTIHSLSVTKRDNEEQIIPLEYFDTIDELQKTVTLYNNKFEQKSLLQKENNLTDVELQSDTTPASAGKLFIIASVATILLSIMLWYYITS